MNSARRAVRLLILGWLAWDVPFDRLRHDDRAIFVKEGYGGRPIEDFPPFTFYRLFADGKPEEAAESFRSWYREQFRKYAREPKRLGGMQGGSLYRLVASECAAEGVPFPADEPALAGAPLERAIERRVSQRLELFVSLRDKGFLSSASTPVLGIRRSGCVYLTGGQHRAAALRVLGHGSFPKVSVFQPSLLRGLKALRIV
jgi:hypothetical protein